MPTTEQAYYLSKDRFKRPHLVLSHLYEISRRGKSIKHISGLDGVLAVGRGWGVGGVIEVCVNYSELCVNYISIQS